ncbi:MAG: hypothetical protein ABDI19_04540 [Armatimonadota bacterium]
MTNIRPLFGDDAIAYEALRRRAKRNLRRLEQEVRAILLAVLRDDIEAVKAELAAQLVDRPEHEEVRGR